MRPGDAPAFNGRSNGRFRYAAAVRSTWADGYGLARLRADVMAGLVVGIVALPLAMALAIASGVSPQHGLYTAVVAGTLAAIFGGSRTSVTGPTAAFVVLLTPVSAQYGLGGLLLASLMAGMILVLMGVARMGRLIQFIPHPVTTGFTAGIAVVIATLQIKDFLGLSIAGGMPDHYTDRVAALYRSLPSLDVADLIIGALTLTVLLGWSRLTKKIPAPLVAVTLAAAVAWLAGPMLPGTIDTIGSRFTYTDAVGDVQPGIPQQPPIPSLAWFTHGPNGERLTVSSELLRDLIGPATAIAILGAIESLLCAVIADGMVGTKHDPDSELIGQGLGNIVAPFFGGFAATGAIARTAANVRAGGRSPVAAVVHSGFVLAAMLVMAPALAYLPMAALAALLLVVAWNMSEAKHFTHTVRTAPRSDVLVLLTCFGLTVIFDMVIAVGVGVVLAALLFMKRMAEISSVSLAPDEHPHLVAKLPEGAVLYEIAGPLFFGAAEKAASALEHVAGRARTVILDMSAVPVIDATGLVALRSAIDKLHHTGALVVLAGVQPKPAAVLHRGGVREQPGRLAICHSLSEAEMLVRLVAHEHEPPQPVPS